MNDPVIPHRQFDEEVRVVAALLDPPPWRSANNADWEDRGIRAAFRRWAPSDGAPSLDMKAPLWQRLNDLEAHRTKQGWDRLVPQEWTTADAERAVAHASMLLHLAALLPDEGRVLNNFGAACRAAGVADGRFARLVNPPPDTVRRLEALSRAFRRFRQQNIRLRFAGEGDTQKDRLAELNAVLRFLFTNDSARSVSRWAQGFFWQPKAAAEPQPAES